MAQQEPERIDLDDAQARAHWAQRLDCSEEQLREAVRVVGDRAADVELHLHGVHSTTNADRMEESGNS